jgi:predicted hydrocarbon binding protein
MERKTRGSVINGYLKYIRKKWGAEGEKQCRKDLGMDDYEFKDGQYYQDEMVGNVLRWINRTRGREAVKDGGRFIMHNMGILSWMVRFTTIKALAEKFPENYSEVYAFGSCKADTSDPKNLRLIFKDVGYYEEACLVWEGICEESLAMTRTKGSVQHTKCQNKGHDHCEFVVRLE